jgi:hypothetical protein
VFNWFGIGYPDIAVVVNEKDIQGGVVDDIDQGRDV